MAAVLNSNRLSLRLARCRTSVQSQRTLTRIPLVNLRQKFQVPYKKPAGGVTLSFNRHFHNMAVDELKAILSEEVPLCTGVIPLHANNSQLFYRNAADGSLGSIDFSTAVSDAQLEHLAQACQPATFGEARKMDTVNFSTNFNPNHAGIIQSIHGLFLNDPESSIQVRLHTLNVYGPGSFFKSQVDTPRSHKMFGSLVVALPTKHEGGTFPLRHHGREWVFNSADLVSPKNPKSPRAAFVAFSGDIDHEVTEGQVWLPCYVDLQPLSRG